MAHENKICQLFRESYSLTDQSDSPYQALESDFYCIFSPWNCLQHLLRCVFKSNTSKLVCLHLPFKFCYLFVKWHVVLCRSFFQDGLKAVDNLKPSIEKLATDLHSVRDSSGLKLTPLMSSSFLISASCFHCCLCSDQTGTG